MATLVEESCELTKPNITCNMEYLFSGLVNKCFCVGCYWDLCQFMLEWLGNLKAAAHVTVDLQCWPL